MDRRTFLAASATLALSGTITIQSVPVAVCYASKEDMELLWGTYGKYAQHELKWVKLGDCETEHLIAILATQYGLQEQLTNAMRNILKDRGFTDEHIDSYVAHRALFPMTPRRPVTDT